VPIQRVAEPRAGQGTQQRLDTAHMGQQGDSGPELHPLFGLDSQRVHPAEVLPTQRRPQ